MLEQIKEKLLLKIDKALDGGVSAETLGHIILGIAELEHNQILTAQKPLDYNRLVQDVKEVVDGLPKGNIEKGELI